MEFTSDCESILTEDFASKFTEILTEENSKDSGFPCEKSERGSISLIAIPNNKKITKPTGVKEKCKTLNFLSTKSPFYQQDNESLVTEGFEDHFKKLTNNNFINDPSSITNRSAPPESCDVSLSVDVGNISNVQPMRRDIMNKFLAKYSTNEFQMSNEMANGERNQYQNKSTEKCKKAHFNPCEKDKEEQKKIKENSIGNSLAQEIRTKSTKIQNEIHEERRRKLESIQEKAMMNEQTPREKLNLKVKELDYLTDKMRQTRSDRERITTELDRLKNNLRSRSEEIRKDIKCNVVNGTNNDHKSLNNLIPSSQFHITENQLSQLNFQLNQKKSQLKELELIIRQRIREIEDLEHTGLSRQEIEQVIEERNDLYEILRQSEENGNNRYELEKRLTEAKEDLSLEYKRSREKIISLEDELDRCFKKITELYEDRDQIARELLVTKENFLRQQDDMDELYHERNDLRCQIDKYKEEIESERSASRDFVNQEKKRLESHLATEEAQSKIRQSELKNEIASLTLDNASLADKNSLLRSKLSEMEDNYQIIKNTMEFRENEYKECLQRTNEEKNEEIEKLKKDFYSSKVNEIQTLKTEFDSEQMRTINNLRDCYKQQLGDLQQRIENKTQEIQDIRADGRKLKQEFLNKEENLKSHYEIEISHLKDELRRSSDFLDKKRINEMEELKIRYESLISKMKKEMDEERLMNERLKSSIEKINKELTHESELIKKCKIEKTASINRIKELAKEKLQDEYKNLKQFYEKELEEQLQIVEKTMQDKNSQITSKCQEIKEMQSEHENKNLILLSNLNNLIESLKYRCHEMADEAKFVAPQWKNVNITENDDIPYIIQTTTKNVQICCQEYSKYHQEIIERIMNQTVKPIEQKASKDLAMIRDQISKDQAEELNSMNLFHKREMNEIKLKHQEEMENIRMSVKAWKCKTAERLAQKLQKEFKKEIERRFCKPDLKMSSSISLSSFKHDVPINNPNPIGLIEDLRGNIRQLREENLSLRKVILGKPSPGVQQIDEQNNYLQSSCSIPNGNNSSSVGLSRPQSASNDNYRKRYHSKDSFMQRSSSFKNCS